MATNFYDKVAKKFGGYAFGSGHVRRISEYTNGDPERIFKKKLLDLAGKDRHVLDAGCGDGKFAFQIAKYFSDIIGIDTSKELLEIAGQKQSTLRVKNIVFEFQDAGKTSFPDKSFDLIFSRRGPMPYYEFYRLLKPNGYPPSQKTTAMAVVSSLSLRDRERASSTGMPAVFACET